MEVYKFFSLIVRLFIAILLTISIQVYAQEQLPTADNLLLEATKEQYKLDNEIREDNWNKDQQNWAGTLSDIQQFINNNGRHNKDDIDNSLNKLDRLSLEVELSIKNAKESLHTNNLLLEGLGKKPFSAKEPESLTATRNQLNQVKRFYENQIQKLDQFIDNAENLKIALSQVRRTEIVEIVKTKIALPFLPSTITTALKTITSRFASVVISSRKWAKEHSYSSKLWASSALILSVTLLAYFLGKFITRKFGRDPQIKSPTHTRKLSAAIVEAIATSLIPILIIGILLVLFNSVYSIDSDIFNSFIKTILAHLLILSIAVTLSIAILSPKFPQWRLTRLNKRTSSKVGNGLIFLIIVVVFNSLAFKLLGINPDSGSNFTDDESQTISFVGSVFNLIKAIILIYLARPSIWKSDGDDSSDPEEDSAVDTMWMLVRLSIISLSCISIIATLMGHVFLGRYITTGIFITILIFGISLLIREAVGDFVSFIIKLKWLRSNFGFRIVTLQKIKFWARFIIDPIIFGAAFLIIMPLWGAPVEKLAQLLKTAFEGFNIGELRISLKGIILSVIVFIVLMRLTKFLQKFIKQNIFPKSTQTLAQQHNTLTIINYLGVIIALSSAVAALGIDFQSIAVILGALSVGIGFGLRNVVSNFVSGLLLLFEKPIKVGDWIQIGQHEGFVKDLKFRSTELETFQKASVIIPNADLISQPVINMTFADEKGRIEIPVSVAYHSDPVIVHNLLLDLANAHPNTLDDPEPFVVFMNFGESSLDFELRAFTNDVISKVVIASDLRFQIERVFREKRIGIPFPQRVVYLKDRPLPSRS